MGDKIPTHLVHMLIGCFNCSSFLLYFSLSSSCVIIYFYWYFLFLMILVVKKFYGIINSINKILFSNLIDLIISRVHELQLCYDWDFLSTYLTYLLRTSTCNFFCFNLVLVLILFFVSFINILNNLKEKF